MYWQNRKWLVRQLLEGVDASEGLDRRSAETLANWTEAARERGAVLFVGAGWKCNAVPSARLPGDPIGPAVPLLWRALASKIDAALKGEYESSASTPTDPLWLAELYRQRFGNEALSRLLAEAVPDERLKPGALHEALLEVPWRTVLTTNYDTLLERTFRLHQRVRVCVDDVDLVGSAAGRVLEIVHLHGELCRPESIVLAYEDYRRYPASHPGFVAKVRQLFLQHPIMFVGFGLADPNFLQWAGWVSDIVGEHKNPWVSITTDPVPTMSHARYWGTSLDFVSIQPFARFEALVPKIFRLLGEALGRDQLSRNVAKWRLLDTGTAPEVIAEVKQMLETGAKQGKEGQSWDHFLGELFDFAASRVLDLTEEPWREPSESEREQRSGISIDMRPSSARERNEELAGRVKGAFGPHWQAWCDMLRPHVGRYWNFGRVGLDQPRGRDVWNSTPIEVRVGGSAEDAESDADIAHRQLREGAEIEVSPRPASPQELRLAGYVAYLEGKPARAAEMYRAAVEPSRSFEPPRVALLTLLSLSCCLDQLAFGDERQQARAEAELVRRQIERARADLAQLPRDDGEEPLRDLRIGAQASLVKQFVSDLDRYDVDRSVRLGVRNQAEEWSERLEGVWAAPPVVAAAVEADGTLKWRYGAVQHAARLLSRYGSKRLEKAVAATIADPNTASADVRGLIDELLRPGRWPAEWLARAEALCHVVPSCTTEQLGRLGAFIERARAVVADLGTAYRGDFAEAGWSARATVERLEACRWKWLTPTDALDSVERWVDVVDDVDARTLAYGRALSELLDLPWSRWLSRSDMDPARVLAVVTHLLERRASSRVRRHGHEHETQDVEALLDVAWSIASDGALAGLDHQELQRVISEAVGLLSESSRRLFAPLEATLSGGDLAAIVQSEFSRIIAADANRADVKVALRVIGIAGKIPEGMEQLFADHLRPLVGKSAAAWDEDAAAPLRNWTALDELDDVAFTVSRLLMAESNEKAHEDVQALLPIVRSLIEAVPRTAEHFTAVSAPRLRDVRADVESAVDRLLRRGDQSSPWSVSEQAYAGLRAVTRGIVHLGPQGIPAEWLINVAGLARAGAPKLATYATWVLSEWASRDEISRLDNGERAIVASALRSAVSDRRVEVCGAALRGLVALEGLHPAAGSAKLIEALAKDERIAVIRSMPGGGPKGPVSS